MEWAKAQEANIQWKRTLQSFQDYYIGLHKPIFRSLFKVVGNVDEAEELTQEVFFRFHNHFHQIQELAKKAWLFRVASNLAFDELKKRKKQRAILQESRSQEYIQENTIQSDTLSAMIVREVLSGMKEQQSKLLLLSFSGLSHEELADVMQVKKSSITQLLSRAKKAFRESYLEEAKGKENQA